MYMILSTFWEEEVSISDGHARKEHGEDASERPNATSESRKLLVYVRIE